MTYIRVVSLVSAPLFVSYRSPSLMERHRAEFEFAFQPGWDGKGAKPLTRDVVADSEHLLRHTHASEPSEVYPGNDGSLSFVWEESDNYVYCDIGPGKSFHLYYKLVDQQPWEGVSHIANQDLIGRLENALSIMNTHHEDTQELDEFILDYSVLASSTPYVLPR